MIKTHGLTHISLAVRDPERSLRFYREVFGVKEYYRDEDSIQVQGPGSHDVLAFERKARAAGAPDGIDTAVKEVERAGGRLLRRGEFAPGLPYAYVHDPDGYEIEIWYE